MNSSSEFRSLRIILRTAVCGVLWLSGACRSPLGSNDEVHIRVRNASDVAFQTVMVQFPTETVDYGTLGPTGESAYRTVQRAYRYARIQLQVETQTYVLQPIDYVGERLLASGRYTYELGFDPGAGGITLELVQDDP